MKRILLATGAGLLLFLLLVSMWIDANDAGLGGAIDLRNRITGARLMSDGTDPYTYKWAPGDPAMYCDPFNNPHLPVSKTTSSPAMLGFTLPWAALPYRSGEFMWLTAEWLFLAGTVRIWWRACHDNWQRALIGLFLTIFTFTSAWRLHVDRGQCYVLFTFLFALWAAWTLRGGRGWAFAAGFAAGFLVMLRPPCAVLLPVLAWRRRDQWLGMSSGLLAGLLLPMMFMGDIWGDYGSAMQEFSYLYRHDFNPRSGLVDYPSFIENIPVALLGYYAPISYSDSSIHRLLREMGVEPISGTLVFLAGTIPFGLWCWRAVARLDLPRLLLGLAAWMYLLDFMLPSYRDSYNDVLALNFLFLGILIAPRHWPAIVPAVLALVAGLAVYAASPELTVYIDTSSVLFAVSAVLWLFAPASAEGLALDRSAAPRQNQSC
jgi:hypothetical protein